ncbi:unnamed protein product, partial [Peniophora sp. CBMAI 1063]
DNESTMTVRRNAGLESNDADGGIGVIGEGVVRGELQPLLHAAEGVGELGLEFAQLVKRRAQR